MVVRRLRLTMTSVRALALLGVLALLAPAPAVAKPASDVATLAERLSDLPGGPRRPVLDAALAAYADANRRGLVGRAGLLTVIDYTRPSVEPRLWVLDLEEPRVLFRELVAHGRESGGNRTERFSNLPGSLMTSLGLFVTDATYVGRNGYSLRLHGLEPGINDNAFDRAIVMHGAEYVSRELAKRLGRLGRSLGCPALPAAVARTIIDRIKGGTVLYAYGPRGETSARTTD
jgi:hypothetical protein